MDRNEVSTTKESVEGGVAETMTIICVDETEFFPAENHVRVEILSACWTRLAAGSHPTSVRACMDLYWFSQVLSSFMQTLSKFGLKEIFTSATCVSRKTVVVLPASFCIHSI